MRHFFRNPQGEEFRPRMLSQQKLHSFCCDNVFFQPSAARRERTMRGVTASEAATGHCAA